MVLSTHIDWSQSESFMVNLIRDTPHKIVSCVLENCSNSLRGRIYSNPEFYFQFAIKNEILKLPEIMETFYATCREYMTFYEYVGNTKLDNLMSQTEEYLAR